jgi:hypothetical protein
MSCAILCGRAGALYSSQTRWVPARAVEAYARSGSFLWQNEDLELSALVQVRKVPCRPRRWTSVSLLYLSSHRNAWASFRLLAQLRPFCAADYELQLDAAPQPAVRDGPASTAPAPTGAAPRSRSGLRRQGITFFVCDPLGGLADPFRESLFKVCSGIWNSYF